MVSQTTKEKLEVIPVRCHCHSHQKFSLSKFIFCSSGVSCYTFEFVILFSSISLDLVNVSTKSDKANLVFCVVCR